jgi:hypothetical protein
VVDIQQHALRAFEQDARTCFFASLSVRHTGLAIGQDEARDLAQFAASAGSRSIGGWPKPARSASW